MPEGVTTTPAPEAPQSDPPDTTGLDEDVASALLEAHAQQGKPPPPDESSPEIDTAAFLEEVETSDDPFWQGGHKLPPPKELLEALPPDARKFAANLKADYTRKRQEAARELETTRAELRAEREAIAAERASFQAMFTPDMTKHLAALADAAKQADPLTRDGQRKIAESQAVNLFQQMIAPIREAAEREAAIAAAKVYVEANPELKDEGYRKQVLELVKARPHLTVEEAHLIHKGKLAQQELTTLRQRSAEGDAARKQALQATSPGGLAASTKPQTPTFDDPEEALAYFKRMGMK